jgi:hypothetical protein
MAQFLRPSSDITTTNITGTFADVDETSANDSDFVVSPDNIAATYETLLSSVTDPLSATGHTVRVRHAKADTGTPPSTSGNSQTASFFLYQGATLIATLGSGITLGAWTTLTYNLTGGQANSITNYADLRVRVDIPASGGGSPSIRRGAAVSWIEMEVPDAAVNVSPSVALLGGDTKMQVAFVKISKDVAFSGHVFLTDIVIQSASVTIINPVNVEANPNQVFGIDTPETSYFNIDQVGAGGGFTISDLDQYITGAVMSINKTGSPDADLFLRIYEYDSGAGYQGTLLASSLAVSTTTLIGGDNHVRFNLATPFLVNQDIIVVWEFGPSPTLLNGTNRCALVFGSVAPSDPNFIYSTFRTNSSGNYTDAGGSIILVGWVIGMPINSDFVLLPATVSVSSPNASIAVGILNANFELLPTAISIIENVSVSVGILNVSSKIQSTNVDIIQNVTISIAKTFNLDFNPIASIVSTSVEIPINKNLDATFEIWNVSVSIVIPNVNVNTGLLKPILALQSVTVTATQNTSIFVNPLIANFVQQLATVSATENVSVNTGVLSASFTVNDVTVTAVGNSSVGVSVLVANFIQQAAAVTAIQNISVGANVLNGNFTLQEATVSTSGNASISVGVLNANFIQQVVTVTAIENVNVSTNVLNAVFTLQTSTVTTAGNILIAVNTLNANFVLQTATVLAIQNVSIGVNVLNAVFTLLPATVLTSGNASISVGILNANFNILSVTVSTAENISIGVNTLNANFDLHPVILSISENAAVNLLIAQFDILPASVTISGPDVEISVSTLNAVFNIWSVHVLTNLNRYCNPILIKYICPNEIKINFIETDPYKVEIINENYKIEKVIHSEYEIEFNSENYSVKVDCEK